MVKYNDSVKVYVYCNSLKNENLSHTKKINIHKIN